MTGGHGELERHRAPCAAHTRIVQGTKEDTLQNNQQSCHQDSRPCYPIKRLLSSMMREKERIYKVLWEESNN